MDLRPLRPERRRAGDQGRDAGGGVLHLRHAGPQHDAHGGGDLRQGPRRKDIPPHRHQSGRCGDHRRAGRVVLARRADPAVAGDVGHGPLNAHLNVVPVPRPDTSTGAACVTLRLSPGLAVDTPRASLPSLPFQHRHVETPRRAGLAILPASTRVVSAARCATHQTVRVPLKEDSKDLQ